MEGLRHTEQRVVGGGVEGHTQQGGGRWKGWAGGAPQPQHDRGGASAASDSVQAGQALAPIAAAGTQWVASMLASEPASNSTGQGCQALCAVHPCAAVHHAAKNSVCMCNVTLCVLCCAGHEALKNFIVEYKRQRQQRQM